MESRIRRIGVEDASKLVNLWNSTFREAYGTLHSPDDIAAYCAEHFALEKASNFLSDPSYTCCVIETCDQPSGFYLPGPSPCPLRLTRPSRELKQIYVLPFAYGTGESLALLEHAIARCRAEEFQWLWLCVSDRNPRAQRFYKKAQFGRHGMGPVLKVGSHRLPSSIMVRHLALV